MRSTFFHFLPRNQEEITEIWNNSLIVLDTNTLLNFYRWSADTSKQFFRLLESVRARLWMPEQVAHEYFLNREGAIVAATKSYEEARTDVTKIKRNFDANRGHPYLSKGIHEKLSNLIDEISAELDTGEKEQSKLLHNDPIRDQILSLYEGKLGVSYDSNGTEKLYEEAEKRYKDEIPPGYKDQAKLKGGKSSDRRAAYGDYLLWQQTIDHAKEKRTHVILVTDDTKEDWFKDQNGQTLGPRPELLKEFNLKTQHHIAIYRPERFMEHAKKLWDGNLTDEAIQEVKDVSEKASAIKEYAKRLTLEKASDKTSHTTSDTLSSDFNARRLSILRALKSLENDEALKSLRNTHANLENLKIPNFKPNQLLRSNEIPSLSDDEAERDFIHRLEVARRLLTPHPEDTSE